MTGVQTCALPICTAFEQWYKKFQNTGDYIDYKAWLDAKKIAANILNGAASDPTKGAVYYHTKEVKPIWRKDLHQVATIGNHIFYRKI